MSNFIKVSVWFILFIVVSSVGFSMLNAANTIENIIGFIIMVYTGECSNNGWEKVDTRIVLRAPYLMWFKWLNKEI